MDSAVIEQLERAIGADKVLSSPVDLIAYSFDGTFEQHLPDVVVLPETNEEVSAVARIGSQYDVPVVPRGMSSGLAGGSIPVRGGIVLSLTRMNRILEIDEQNMTATVEAGLVTADLQAEVEKLGLFYPPDPSSIKQSTIGGNVACNAGGPRCLKYGVTGDYVMGLTVILADGRVIKTGGKAIKYVTGFNMNQFFVGSEGALGIITEVILRLVARPPYARTALVHFPTLDDAGRSVQAVLARGLVPATLELLDETAIECIEEAMQLGLPLDVEAILLIEADGSDAESVQREIDAITDICLETGASRVDVARNGEERDELWRARRSVSPSLARKAPNKLGEDITVPRSAIPEAIRRIKAIGAKYGLPIVVFGHAGDGNLHPNILFDKRDPDQWAKIEPMVGEIFHVALDVGGTLSGEHGIGTFKLPYMREALGPASINIQWRIKQALDPQNILNPGKVLPEP
ncbi:MAG: FAD-linked oxidase C-terminal domain-containing protein [Chloroflexota bacterium]|nr:FAD-linked oxidase C-terminal domain-containing protein [Chloroflexota bacterium]